MAFRNVHPNDFEPVLPPPPPNSVLLVARHRWVRIIGALIAQRDIGGSMIRVYGFHPVVDPYESCAHILQVRFANVMRTKGRPVCTQVDILRSRRSSDL